jgi:hypothetical protein
MAKKDVVELTADERTQWLALLKKGKGAARKVGRAQILLQANEEASDAVIAVTLHVGVATVERTRKRFVEEGLAAALPERRRPGGRPKLQGKDEAFLLAPACSGPPTGRQRGTSQVLADRGVEGGIVDAISADPVGRPLKNPPFSQGCNRRGVSRRSAASVGGAGQTSGIATPSRLIRAFRWWAVMSVRIKWRAPSDTPRSRSRAKRGGTMINIGAPAPVICVWSAHPAPGGAMGRSPPAVPNTTAPGVWSNWVRGIIPRPGLSE